MALANVALALIFLLGAGAAQAFTINTSDNRRGDGFTMGNIVAR